MPFKLVFVAANPEQYVFCNEKKLRGLEFLTTAGSLLRRVLDDGISQQHQMLGNRKYYCVAIPNRVAIDSGKYEDTEVFYVHVRNDWLKQFIFYSAEMRCGRNAKNYPFTYKDSVVVTSHIDELAAVERWIELGYPTCIGINPDDPEYVDPDNPSGLDDILLVNDVTEVKRPCDGMTVFDIIEEPAVDLNTNNQ